jgi:hypothetical protein
VSDTSIHFLTLVLGGIVLLSSAMFDRDHSPPAGARAAIELITDSRGRGTPKSSRSQKMDTISTRGVFHATAGEALRRSSTAGNPHFCGSQDAAAT